MLLIIVLCGFMGWLFAVAGGQMVANEKPSGTAAVLIAFVFIMLAALVGR